MHDLLCIKGMLAETASEGDDVTRYFDSLGLEDTSYSPDYNCIEHQTYRSSETVDFTLSTMRHRCQACKVLVTLVG